MLVIPCVVALLAGLWGGLQRLGWTLPELSPALASLHGPLMVSGFLGTLICLERAVGLGARWGYAVPALSGASLLLILLSAGTPSGVMVGQGGLVLASLGLLGLYATLLRRHVEPFTSIMALGAVAWGVGNLLWLLQWPVFRLVPWWLAFLILTIAGERLEMTRLMKPVPCSREAFYGLVVLLFAGLAMSLQWPDGGLRLVGIGFVALAGWLLRFDIARKTVKQTGLPRYVALCLLSGYVWLGMGGLLLLTSLPLVPGLLYDAFLHAVLVGFVLAMIFGHAPIVLPAIFRIPLPFHRGFYLPLGLLQVTLLTRLLADLLGAVEVRRWAGLLNELTLVLFLGLVLRHVLGSALSARGRALPLSRE